jgi:hypothetical protein
MSAWESYYLAMAVKTPEQAEVALGNLIDLAMSENPELDYEKAKEIQLQNIGYWTGYLGDREQAKLVLKLYGTEHPIFGHFEHDITPEKALRAGMALAEMMKDKGLTQDAILAARAIIEQP